MGELGVMYAYIAGGDCLDRKKTFASFSTPTEMADGIFPFNIAIY